MPQEVIRQTTFNGGELDPRVKGRRDVKPYYAMLQLAENVVTTPLGTATRRPGTVFVDYARHVLQPIAFNVGMVLTANGGDPADLVAEDGALFETEQNLGADDHLLVTIDFGAPVEVSCIDVIDYCVKPAGETAAPPPFQYPYDPPVFDGPIVIGPIEIPDEL